MSFFTYICIKIFIIFSSSRVRIFLYIFLISLYCSVRLIYHFIKYCNHMRNFYSFKLHKQYIPKQIQLLTTLTKRPWMLLYCFLFSNRYLLTAIVTFCMQQWTNFLLEHSTALVLFLLKYPQELLMTNALYCHRKSKIVLSKFLVVFLKLDSI